MEPSRTTEGRTQAIRYVVFAVVVGVITWVSVPFGYGPLLVGLVLLGAGMWARRRDPGLARMAQILGVVIAALGLLILAGLTTTTSSGGDGPSSPQQAPRHR